MFFVIAFHRSGVIKKVWIRDEKQVESLMMEEYTVYRVSAEQLAVSCKAGEILWKDLKEELKHE